MPFPVYGKSEGWAAGREHGKPGGSGETSGLFCTAGRRREATAAGKGQEALPTASVSQSKLLSAVSLQAPRSFQTKSSPEKNGSLTLWGFAYGKHRPVLPAWPPSWALICLTSPWLFLKTKCCFVCIL